MLGSLIVVLHVWSVFWLVSGLAGRDTCYWQAARAADLATLRTLADVAGVFEAVFVRPATFVVLATGLAAAALRGYPILGFLQGGGPNWVLAALLIYLSIIPLIVFVFLPKGRIYRAALAEATLAGAPTPALRRAIQDPVVVAARVFEIAMVATLALLMLTQPF